MLAKIFIVSLLIISAFAEKEDCVNIDSDACQEYDEARQNAINNQITMELEASYIYMAMGTYFSRDNPDRKGFADFFFKASLEEREHAMKLVEYQNLRGGKVQFSAIKAPSKHEYTSGLQAMEEALKKERDVNESLLKLHKTAANDPNMQDFLETHFLGEQVESIRQLAGYVNQLKRLRQDSPELGEHMFDRELSQK